MHISNSRGKPPARSRSRAPQEVRRRLLQAVTELVAARGFEGVNSNQIARAAGVGVGTFYGHFEDKHEAFQAVVVDALESLQACIAAGAASPEEPLGVQVRALVESVVAFAEEGPERFQVAFGREAGRGAAPRSAASPGGGAQRYAGSPGGGGGQRYAGSPGGGGRAVVGYSTRVAERRLRDLQTQGLVEAALSPSVAARAFLEMQNGVVSWWLEDRERASRDEVIETLILLHPAVAARTATT